MAVEELLNFCRRKEIYNFVFLEFRNIEKKKKKKAKWLIEHLKLSVFLAFRSSGRTFKLMQKKRSLKFPVASLVKQENLVTFKKNSGSYLSLIHNYYYTSF